jgi:hypothetical protein
MPISKHLSNKISYEWVKIKPALDKPGPPHLHAPSPFRVFEAARQAAAYIPRLGKITTWEIKETAPPATSFASPLTGHGEKRYIDFIFFSKYPDSGLMCELYHIRNMQV